MDAEKFPQVVREIPWRDQVGKSGDGAEPSLKIMHQSGDGDAFLVSVVGDEETLSYVVGAIYQREVPASQLSEQAAMESGSKMVRWAELVVVKPIALVELYAGKYFAGDLEQLLSTLRKAPPFMSAPASEVPHIGED